MLRCEALSSFSSDSQKMLSSSLTWSTCTVAECGKASPAASRTLVRSPRSPESLFRHASDHLLRFALFSPNHISIFHSHSKSLVSMPGTWTLEEGIAAAKEIAREHKTRVTREPFRFASNEKIPTDWTEEHIAKLNRVVWALLNTPLTWDAIEEIWTTSIMVRAQNNMILQCLL